MFVFCRDTDSLVALKKSGVTGPQMEFGPDATFAIDLGDEAAANRVLKQHGLTVRPGNSFAPSRACAGRRIGRFIQRR